MNNWHPMAIEKIKIMGAVLELPAKQPLEFWFFQLPWVPIIHLCLFPLYIDCPNLLDMVKLGGVQNLPKRNTLNVWSCDPVKTLPPWQSRQVNGWWWALVEEINSNRRSSSDLKKLVLSQPSKDTPLPVRTWSEIKKIS